MKRIDLEYLGISRDHKVIEILKSYGEQISSGTYNMITYMVFTTKMNGSVISAAFYIVVPELNKQHLLLMVNNVNNEIMTIVLDDPTATPMEKIEHFNTNGISDDYSEFENTIGDILESKTVKNIFIKYYDGIKLKKEIKNI